jgi:hypothetical protein
MIRLNNNTNYHLDYIRMALSYVKHALGAEIKAIESITLEQDRVIVFGVDCIIIETLISEIDEFYRKAA